MYLIYCIIDASPASIAEVGLLGLIALDAFKPVLVMDSWSSIVFIVSSSCEISGGK